MGLIRLQQNALRKLQGDLHPVHFARASTAMRPRIYGHRMRPYGDPGLGDFFGGIAKTISGVVKATPIGGLVSKVIPSPEKLHQMFSKHKTGIAAGAGALAAAGAAGLAGMLGGKGGGGGGGIPGMRRRYRRMNPLNYRALKRSTRRIHAASKIMRTVFTQVKHTRVPKRQPRGVRGYRRKVA